MIMTLALFNCIFVPVQVCFAPEYLETLSFDIINYIIDIFFLLDILINFRTIYIDGWGIETRDPKRISRLYIMNAFLLDILATIPFDSILKLSTAYQDYVKRLKKNKES